MGIRIGISTIQIAATSEASFWTSRSLFHLDGNIFESGGNYYFRDKSNYARHFLITGYDFPTGWTLGFPYKSAATISAPADDAELIAADVNHFWYDAGGTPNQIPVVSLFQDIDYEHKIFSRHAAQLVDANGIEIYEPRVLEVYMAKTVEADAILTRAQTYFGVPTELTTGMKWVDGVNGNDTTGNGSKATPYKTIIKALTIISAGQTIYARTGICTEDTGGLNLYCAKNCTITGTGFTQVRGAGNVANPLVRIEPAGTFVMNGIIVDGTGGYQAGIQSKNDGKTFNRCCVRNIASTQAYYLYNVVSINYCLLLNGRIDISAATATVNTCLIYTAYLYPVVTTGAAMTLNLINSKIQSRAGNSYMIYIVAGAVFLFKGNTMNVDNVCIPIYITTNINVTCEYSYNNINVTATLVTEVIKFAGSAGATAYSSFNIHHNRINITNTAITQAVILLYNTATPIINNNVILSESPVNAGIKVYSNGATIGAVTISNNYLSIKKAGSFGIQVGTDGTTANDNKLNNSVITNNVILHQGFHDPSLIGTLSVHGIFVGYNINPTIAYNYVDGGGYGILREGNSAETDTIISVKYNVVRNCGNGLFNAGILDCKFIGNLYVFTKAGAVTPLRLGDLGYSVTGFVVKNNIFYCPLAELNTNIYDKTGGDIDHNIYHGTSYQLRVAANVYPSLAAYVAAETLDVNSSNADPLVVNFRPQAGSPAYGFGEDLGGDVDEGLDFTSDWNEGEDIVPVIIRKQQPASWDAGAFIHN